MKKQLLFIMIIILLAGLADCAGKTPGTGVTDPASSDTAALKVAEQNSGALIRRDGQGLVEVRIEDGKAELTFDLEKWDKLCDIYNIYNALETENAGFLREGPYEIKSSEGKKIRDVCVGMVEALNDRVYGFDCIAAVLLMEDGTLEYRPVYPYPWQILGDWAFYSWGKLPWLEDMVSLSYEPDGEGIGEMTIYAIDRDGLCYDVRFLCRLSEIFEGEWIYETGPSYGGNDIDCIFLTFEESGSLSLRRGLLYNGDCYLFCEGKYTVSLSGTVPVLSFELWDSWEDPDFESPPKLTGEYFFTADLDGLTLYLLDGEPLCYFEDNTPVTTYPFWADMSGGYEPQTWYEGDDLVDYLLSNVPFAYQLVYGQNMSTLVTGETVDLTDMGAGLCRIVILGTDHPEHFINERFFAVSEEGNIYVYSSEEDIWQYYSLYTPGESE